MRRLGRNPALKTFLIASAAILAVLLNLTWVMFAVIETNKAPLALRPHSGTRVVAHRGYSGKYPGNTSLAFQKAGETPGFDGIETDIRRTADGVWVCSHDDNPFEDKSVRISKSKFSDIESLNLDVQTNDPTEHYRIPTYDAYLDACARCGKFALVEFKGKLSVETVREPVERAISRLGASRAIFGSFSLKTAKSVSAAAPNAQTLVFSSDLLSSFALCKMHRDVGASKKIFNSRMRKRASALSTRIAVFTITDREEYARFEKEKVDFIIADFPKSAL